jgi:hypothetical protein
MKASAQRCRNRWRVQAGSLIRNAFETSLICTGQMP